MVRRTEKNPQASDARVDSNPEGSRFVRAVVDPRRLPADSHGDPWPNTNRARTARGDERARYEALRDGADNVPKGHAARDDLFVGGPDKGGEYMEMGKKIATEC